MSELIVLEEVNAVEIFEGEDEKLHELLEQIRVKASSFVPDTSTAKGRKEIASFAAKVSKCKTYLDGAGKGLVDELKKRPKLIDAKRKRMREFLDDLKINVREPLTQWEEVEEERIATHGGNIAEIIMAGEAARDRWQSLSLEQMVDRLQELKDEERGEKWEEYAVEADEALNVAIERTEEAIEKKKVEVAEKEELDRLRAEAAERDQKEAARVALEEERKFNEEKAAKEEKRIKDEAEAAARAAVDKANREKQEAIDAQERAEQDAKNAEEKAFREIEEKQRKEQAETAAREADTKHRGKINREAVNALVAIGIKKEDATTAVKGIASNMIPNVKINY